MEYSGVILALALSLELLACGGSTTPVQSSTNTVTGTWSELLASPSKQPLGTFSFALIQNNANLAGRNLDLSNLGDLAPCFGSGSVLTGQLGPAMTNGGSINMTITWSPQGSAMANIMIMQGNVASGLGVGNGTFTLAGQTSGCTSQTGTFSMTRTSTSVM